MEYEELEKMWHKYDSKLDNLERLNKKLIIESLIKKPKRKLNFFKYKSIQSIVIYPIALTILFLPNFRIDNIDWKLFVGSLLVLSILGYLIYMNLLTYKVLNKLDLLNDSVIESSQKGNKIKNVFKTRYKNALYTLPILYIGILLIKWNDITFNTETILFVSILFIVLFLYNLKGSNIHKSMISKWEKEIEEFNEYVK
jgi:hypothetical protein